MTNPGTVFGRLAVWSTVALASVLRADPPTVFELPLDELLATPISTAAKYEQTLSSVAASVTIITAEDIERYGWTSLPDVLESVPGFYITDDRNYTYIGVRGIGRPTDYNSRIMILLNGVVLNGDIFGSAAFPQVSSATIERIEIVRGPGSALYGSHAMLAVVNVITKDADAIDGVGGSLTYGSHGKRAGTVLMGKTLAGGLRVTASATWMKSAGADLYFPEFDSPTTNDGVAEGRDYEEMHDVLIVVDKGKFRLTGSTASRTKGIPTASYGTTFNADAHTTDQQTALIAEYTVSLGAGKKLDLRGGYESARSRGVYPYDSLGVDRSLSTRYRTEARFHWDVRPNHRLTSGVEVSRSTVADYNYVVGDYRIDLHRPHTRASFYLQDEYHPSPKLGIVAGLRHDTSPISRSSTSPRAAILYTPNRSTTVKLLYGTAFRTPTVYESEFEDPMTPWKRNPDLKPETIRTAEVVLEQRVSPELFLLGSLFRVDASDLINQQIDPADSTGWYQNIGTLDSTGGEMSVEWRKTNGVWGRFGFSSMTAKEGQDPISNSPRTMFNAGVSSSPRLPWHAGMEGIYESPRRTRDGDRTSSFFLLNGTLTRKLGDRFRAGLTVRNLFDTHYATPVGPELVQQAIAQDGRTLELKLSYSR